MGIIIAFLAGAIAGAVTLAAVALISSKEWDDGKDKK